MQTGMVIALSVSVLANLVLFVRNYIWRERATNMRSMLMGTNKRLIATFNLLWKEAESRGVKDKNEFTNKLILLAETPEPVQEAAAEKLGIMPAKAQGSLGFH